MVRINILNKEGLLSTEDRKEPLEHHTHHFMFKTNLDLSIPVRIIPFGNQAVFDAETYTREVASFFCWWNHFVFRDLNGFSGFSHVKFELVGFTLQ